MNPLYQNNPTIPNISILKIYDIIEQRQLTNSQMKEIWEIFDKINEISKGISNLSPHYYEDVNVFCIPVNKMLSKYDLVEDRNRILEKCKKILFVIEQADKEGPTRQLINTLISNDKVDINEVKELLANGVTNVNAKAGNLRETPLIWAVHNKRPDIVVELLKESITDVNCMNSINFTALCYAREPAIAQLLINDPRTDVNGGRVPLLEAVLCECPEVVRVLLSCKDIDVNKIYRDDSPLMAACRRNNTEIIKILLSDDRINVNQDYGGGKTLLLTSMHHQKCEAAMILLNDKRIDVNIAEINFKTPIFVLDFCHGLELAKILIERTNFGVENEIGKDLLIHTERKMNYYKPCDEEYKFWKKCMEFIQLKMNPQENCIDVFIKFLTNL